MIPSIQFCCFFVSHKVIHLGTINHFLIMDKFNANTDGHIGEDSFESPTVKTTGDKPKTIHVAHRRSPSELTTLMRMYCINFFFPPLLFFPHFFCSFYPIYFLN